MDEQRPVRRHRRAVGPPGAVPVRDEPKAPAPTDRGSDDDERLLADRPPHHDRGV